MKKVLITGSNSLLGFALIKTVPKKIQLILGYHKKKIITEHNNFINLKLDIINIHNVKKILSEVKPDIIIHAAAISNVDYCEKHKKVAYEINVKGTKNILEASKKFKTKIFFISSNALFDGKKKIYSEKDKPNPLNYYGKTKLLGETFIGISGVPFVIARLMTMYGWQPKNARFNPVTWLLDKLENGIKIKIVNDVYLNPLYNIDAANIIWKLIEKNSQGIYNIAGSEMINRYEWMIKTAKIFNKNVNLISPVPSKFFNKKMAQRPKKTIFSIEKIIKEFHIIPQNVSRGLRQMKRNYE